MAEAVIGPYVLRARVMRHLSPFFRAFAPAMSAAPKTGARFWSRPREPRAHDLG